MSKKPNANEEIPPKPVWSAEDKRSAYPPYYSPRWNQNRRQRKAQAYMDWFRK